MKVKAAVSAGDRFGRLVVVEPDLRLVQANGKAVRAVRCECDCGGQVTLRLHNLLNASRSCGCGVRAATAERNRSPEARARSARHGRSKSNLARLARMGADDGLRAAAAERMSEWNRSPEHLAYIRGPEQREHLQRISPLGVRAAWLALWGPAPDADQMSCPVCWEPVRSESAFDRHYRQEHRSRS